VRLFATIAILMPLLGYGQSWEIIRHPNNNRMAIKVDSQFICDYIYTEVSVLSEQKAYVAQGELYAYIDHTGKRLTPFAFTQVSNFTDGYAVVGDSFSQSIITDKMHILIPFEHPRVLLPVHGLIVVQSTAGTWGVYDTLGKIRLPLIYDIPPQIVNLNHIIVRREEEYGVVNDCNEVVFNCSYQYIDSNGLGYSSGKYLKLF
jgi:hypothetical protein